jgi:hypothetical protein
VVCLENARKTSRGDGSFDRRLAHVSHVPSGKLDAILCKRDERGLGVLEHPSRGKERLRRNPPSSMAPVLDGRVEERDGVFVVREFPHRHEGRTTRRFWARDSHARSCCRRILSSTDAITERLAARFPEIALLRPLYEVVAVAEAIRKVPDVDLSFIGGTSTGCLHVTPDDDDKRDRAQDGLQNSLSCQRRKAEQAGNDPTCQ